MYPVQNEWLGVCCPQIVRCGGAIEGVMFGATELECFSTSVQIYTVYMSGNNLEAAPNPPPRIPLRLSAFQVCSFEQTPQARVCHSFATRLFAGSPLCVQQGEASRKCLHLTSIVTC